MSADGVLSRNDTEFRLYRKYSAEAEIKYDITPDAIPADQTKETAGDPAKRWTARIPRTPKIRPVRSRIGPPGLLLLGVPPRETF